MQRSAVRFQLQYVAAWLDRVQARREERTFDILFARHDLLNVAVLPLTCPGRVVHLQRQYMLQSGNLARE